MRKFPLPSSFDLAGREWKVVIKPLDDELCGKCDCDKRTIFLNVGLDTDELADAFCHEIVHAYKYTLGWDDNEENHAECDALGGLILQFMRTYK